MPIKYGLRRLMTIPCWIHTSVAEVQQCLGSGM